MSELVEIKAEDLRWCHEYFSFRCEDVSFFLDGYDKDQKLAYADHGNSVFEDGLVVEVNPLEYEKAVIERIKEMIHLALTMYKHIIKKELGHVYIEYLAYGGTWKVLTPIFADPRPWQEEYTIEIKEV